MRIPRIYHPTVLTAHSQVELSSDAAHHVARVLRMTPGEELHLFDGSGHFFSAQILLAERKKVLVQLAQGVLQERESPLHLHLGQVISRGERMEFTIQKAVELGVNAITPLTSERCGVKLEGERLEKKVEQWRKIAIAACEQCGRNRLPILYSPLTLQNWCQQEESGLKLNLHPQASSGISSLPESTRQIRLLIGPEGGLGAAEISMAHRHHFTDILLGPRILRTETAALAAITALQVRFGDLG